MSMTPYEAHDGSAEPTARERLIEAVIDDIQHDGTASMEAGESLAIKDGRLKASFRMNLVGSLSAVGTAFEGTSDAILGKYVRLHFINTIEEEL